MTFRNINHTSDSFITLYDKNKQYTLIIMLQIYYFGVLKSLFDELD